MAYSKHRAIREAVAALMLAGTPVCGGRVFQNRAFKLATDVASQLHVNYGDSTPEVIAVTGAPVDWRTQIELRILVRAAGATPAVDVADEIWADVYARVMADQSLGGLVGLLDPGPMAVDTDEADTSVARLAWLFSVDHRTSNNVIT